MEAIRSGEQYNQLVKEFKVAHKSKMTNHYMMFNEVERLIAANRLSYQLTDDALFFFKDEGPFWDMSFLADKNFKGGKLAIDKQCVAAVVNKGEELSATSKKIVDFLTSYGFKYSRVYLNYDLNLPQNIERIKKESEELELILKKLNMKVIPYEEKYGEDIRYLWDTYLDADEIILDDWDHFRSPTPLVVDEEGKLCGVQMMRIEGKKCSLWHCVIVPEHRRKKLGRILTYLPMMQAAEQGYEIIENWLADTNIASRRACELDGMKHNGMYSYRYEIKP